MKNQLGITGVIIIFILVNSLFADGKKFARSYTANTLPANEFEMELSYLNRFDKMAGSFQSYDPKIEFEYGILDQLTASFYFNFSGIRANNNSFVTEPFKLESNSLEIRYRFTEIGDKLIDPAIYFEFEYGKNVIGYEPKIILSKNYKKIESVLNITSEFERERNSNEQTTNFEVTGGAIYKFTPVFAAGFEFRHSRIYENVFGKSESEATFLGPTININSDDFSLTINLMKQLAGSPANNGSLEHMQHENYELKAILEIEL